jgi:hypothetical protein
MQIPKGQLITMIVATFLIFAIATFSAMPRLEVFAQGKLMAEAQAQATACKVVDIYEAPKMDITYKRPPDETGVRVERRMETPTKPNPLFTAHPTTPTLPAKTPVFTDTATAQSTIEDVTYHYRFMTFNADGDNGVWSDPVCKTIKKLRTPPLTPVVVMS